MRSIKVNGKEYNFSFGFGMLAQLEEQGISLNNIQSEMEAKPISTLITVFHAGVKQDMSKDEMVELIDDMTDKQYQGLQNLWVKSMSAFGKKMTPTQGNKKQ